MVLTIAEKEVFAIDFKERNKETRMTKVPDVWASLLASLDFKLAHRRFTDSTGYFLRSELRLLLQKKSFRVPVGGVVLEIGTFEGLGAVYFARKFRAQVYTVDPFETGDPGTPLSESTEENCRKNLGKSGVGSNIRQFRQTSDEFFSQSRSPDFDFIYIDGSHDPAVLARDLDNSLRRLTAGGILWIDDYGSDYRVSGTSLRDVVDDFYSRNTDRLEAIHVGYQAGFKLRSDNSVNHHN